MFPAASTAPRMVHQLCRRVVVPAMLVPTHELEPNRRAGEVREHRGRLDPVVIRRRAVDARPLDVGHPDLVRRQVQPRQREGGLDPAAAVVAVLRVAEDPCAARRHVGDDAGRADRKVPVVGHRVCGRDGVGGTRDRAVDAAEVAVRDQLRLPARVLAPHLTPEVPDPGQRRHRSPGHLQLGCRLDGVVLLGRHDADEVVLLQQLRPRDVTDGAGVDRQHLRRGSAPVCALSPRPHDPAVQHPGHSHVVHERIRSRHLRRNVDPRRPGRLADERVRADRLRAWCARIEPRARRRRAAEE